jgi:integrase
MPLTDAGIRASQPRDKPFKRADGKGLFLLVTPTGSKLWRLKYRSAGKEKQLALGSYPETSLSEARKHRDLARSKINRGLDPCLERKRQKAAAWVSADNTFESLAKEYIEKMRKQGAAEATLKKAHWFSSLLQPAIGSMPITEVDPQLLLAGIRRLENKGNYETSKKTRSFASRVFRFAVVTGRASSDPAALLQGALIAKKARHYAAILEPAPLGALLRAIDDYSGSPATKLALQILPHVFVRPGELRLADWSEFNFEECVWTIPSGRMKARLPHCVPLSNEVLALLKDLHELTGPEGLSFPAVHTSKRPMSENTMNAALRRMGFSKDEVTAHGFRATASSLLNESGLWTPDAIERALAHGPSNSVRATYHRGQHWSERVKMAAWWSGFLDRLKADVPFRPHEG